MQKHFFVNLKRFDVPTNGGGICQHSHPAAWVRQLVPAVAQHCTAALGNTHLTLFVPESLVIVASESLADVPVESRGRISIGCQGVHFDDVAPKGNFGAMTSLRSAKAMQASGCSWALVGHSEERKMLQQVLTMAAVPEAKIQTTIDTLLQSATQAAFQAGLRVLYCVGESAAQRGTGSENQYRVNAAAVLRSQCALLTELRNTDGLSIAYEPLWAIGPGKTPPSGEYIRFALCGVREPFTLAKAQVPAVVYGGGLKEENAREVAQAGSDGGLIALTRFTGDIGFYPEECAAIIRCYLTASA